MKKTAIIVGAILASLSISPAYAEPVKTLAIIDSYFDASKLSGQVETVCVAVSGCGLSATPISGLTSPVNHGTAMAELALKQNSNIKLLLIRASSATKNAKTGVVSLSTLNGNDFLTALKFIQSRSDVSAISFSYNLTGNGPCSLATTGLVNVKVVDPAIRQTIASLKSSGVPLFVATGNDSNRKPVAYPACITDTNSVSTAIAGRVYSIGNNDINTDYFGSLPANTYNYKSAIFGLIPQTTSSANVSVAAKYLAVALDNKFVNVLQ